jgi:hypothetical protein
MSKVGCMEPEGMEKACTKKARMTRAIIRAINKASPYSRQKGFFWDPDRALAYLEVIDSIVEIFRGPGCVPVAAVLIHRLELVLGGAADGTDPFRGHFVKRGIGGNVIVRITRGRIINITTDLTLILLHDFLLG